MSEPTHPDSSASDIPQDDLPAARQTEAAAEKQDTPQDASPAEEQEQHDDAPEPEKTNPEDEKDFPPVLDESGAADGSDAKLSEDSDPARQEEAGQQDDQSTPADPHQTAPADQPGEEQQEKESEQPPLAEPPARTGVAPVINVPTGPDTGLGGFFDTLDERAKEWWATYRIRRARKKVLAVKAAKEQPVTPPSDEDSAKTPGPPPDAPAGHRARHSGSRSGPQSSPDDDSARIGLPKPPPAEQRPADQLFTGSIPVVAEEGSTPSADKAPVPSNEVDDDDRTTVLPAYRGDEPAAPASAPSRRELDELRRRNVIAQKATAIEKATSDPAPAPYGGSGYIGSAGWEYSYEPADDEEDLYTYIPPYNLPSRDTDPEPTQWDLARRVFVSVGALAAVISTLWMFGWFSPSEENPAILTQNGLQEAYADGWFSGELALLSPDHNWYWIWPLIALTLVAHSLYQWRPSQRSTPRQQRSGWWVGTASLLMLVLTAALHTGIFTLALLSAVTIAAALTQAIRQFNLYTARSDTERQLTDDIIGLFYGFAVIQAMSTLSIWLTQRGWDIPGIPAALWAIAGLLLCIWIAAFYSMTERGRITIALGLAWGLFWLVFPRILGEVTSVWVALGAALGAFIVILCTQSRRYRINHAERRAAMGRPLEDII